MSADAIQRPPAGLKLAAVVCTYKRPKYLGWLINCFLEQDYPRELCEMVILDDAGQYRDQAGDGWRLVSTATRFPTLGDKRNAAIRLASDDVDAFCVWDDDDIYLPWALRATAAALETAPWSRPSLVLHEHKGQRLRLRRHRTGGLYHGGWAYRRDVWSAVGGYPAASNGEDQRFAARLKRAGVAESDPIKLGFEPFYIYRWGPGTFHLSGMGPENSGYKRLAARPSAAAELEIS